MEKKTNSELIISALEQLRSPAIELLMKVSEIYRRAISAVLSFHEGNRLLSHFPSEIPGAVAIQKYPKFGAKALLVVIRQTHVLDSRHPDANKPSLIKAIQLVHSDIKKILLYLIANEVINPEVFLEGMNVGEEDEFLAQCREAVKHANQIGSEALNGLRGYFSRSAPIELQMDGKIKVHGSKTKETANIRDDTERYIAREDDAVRLIWKHLITNEHGKIGVLIMGAEHDMVEAVDRNEFPFATVVITPNAILTELAEFASFYR